MTSPRQQLISITNIQGQYTYINAAYASVLGLDPHMHPKIIKRVIIIKRCQSACLMRLKRP